MVRSGYHIQGFPGLLKHHTYIELGISSEKFDHMNMKLSIIGGGGGGGEGNPIFPILTSAKSTFILENIGKEFFANISLPDHFRAYVDS